MRLDSEPDRRGFLTAETDSFGARELPRLRPLDPDIGSEGP
jgi:hypothetical protein